MFCVIGSGPSAIGCISSLLDQGLKVTVLDIGNKLDSAKRNIVSKLGSVAPSCWEGNDVASLQEGIEVSNKGIPLKLFFGSDFPYQLPEVGTDYQCGSVGALPSFALGGLSNVWGAAMLPYRDEDMLSWPFGRKELEPHYKAVLKLTGLSATEDDLLEYFPLYTDSCSFVPGGKQTENLFQDLWSSRETLRRKKVFFGRSRLAFKQTPTQGCEKCNLCMYGCPYGVIFNSSQLIHEWSAAKKIEYIDNVIVEKVEEKKDHILVHGLSTSGEVFQCAYERVFLAAGLLPSTAIILRSQDRYEEPITALDSQYFIFPFLRFFGSGKVTQEKMHTLSQLFIEIMDPLLSASTIHLQAYGYNDLIYKALQKTFRFLMPDAILQQILSRLLVFQGYLHSDCSSKLQLTLQRSQGREILQVIPLVNTQTGVIIKKILRKITFLASSIKGVPLIPMLQMGEVGRGFHSGGSFAMARNPTNNQSDLLGRPSGFRKLHLVDSSSFPSVPATTVTYTAMANAHRIATQSLS